MIGNLIEQTSTTTGTGNFTLSTKSGKRSFSTEFGTGKFYYFISHQSAAEWEIGVGYLSGGALVRETILSSTNSDAAVNFSSGDKDVVNALPAQITGTLGRAQAVTTLGYYL